MLSEIEKMEEELMQLLKAVRPKEKSLESKFTVYICLSCISALMAVFFLTLFGW